MAVDKVLLAAPRGFCAGVEMAIKALAWMVRVFEPPVYCYHEIVHNQLVVDRFRRPGRGVRRRHRRGAARARRSCSPPTARPPRSWPRPGPQAASSSTPCARWSPRCTTRSRCGPARATPSSTSATRATTRRSAPWRSRPTRSAWCETEDDVAALADPGTPVALLAQTTLCHHDWAGVLEAVRERFPDLWMPGRSDLCFATTNRQSALKAIAARADAIVVIGSANSSNTLALEQVARAAGCRGSTGSTAPTSCPTTSSGVVGVTAGASAPEELVEAVIARLAPADGVEVVASPRGRVLPAAPRAARACCPRARWPTTAAVAASRRPGAALAGQNVASRMERTMA